MPNEDEQQGSEGARAADQVYHAPSSAQDAATRTIGDPTAPPAERAEALATLGRIAYYDNRMTDATAMLQECLALTDDDALRAETALILAPALSKQGRSEEAFALLDADSMRVSPELDGKAHNQRGAMLVELGRLPEALRSFRRAFELHNQCGYLAGEGRALLNMAAAASEIGDQRQAERWYEDAWKLNREAGQLVMCAMIEGNLGYVASRKGDFGAAISWYGRGRQSFAELGDVELLVAVLEVDHAGTLLDVGLYDEARKAAESARRSSSAGSNHTLSLQADLLLGEAQLRLQLDAEARRTLERARTAARQLGLQPWLLRCDYLSMQLEASALEPTELSAATTATVVDGMVAAGWHREALRTIAVGAHALAAIGRDSDALQLLRSVTGIDTSRADPIDRCHRDALVALLTDDLSTLQTAIDHGFVEINRQRHLLASAELRARLGRRTRDFREIALDRPLREADAVRVLEIENEMRSATSPSQTDARIVDLRSQLRDHRVRQQEARLNGGPSDELVQDLRKLEKKLLAHLAPSERALPHLDVADVSSLGTDAVCITYIEHRGQLHAVVTDDQPRLVELGPLEKIGAAVRSQQMSLRRMAAGRGRQNQQRIETVNLRLDALLVAPLGLEPDRRVVIVPDGAVAGISWAGLPTLTARSLAIAPSLRKLLSDRSQVAVSTADLLTSGSLGHGGDDVAAIAEIWRDAAIKTAVTTDATRGDTVRAFSTSDLVHVAAHGEFRSDNPFFSSIALADGPLMLVDLDRAGHAPGLVVLASCEAGASHDVGSELIGTTDALLALGTRAVVAPTVIVDDAAAHRFVVDLHCAMSDGLAIDASVRRARLAALDRSTDEDTAAALAFQVHGDAGVLTPLRIGTGTRL